MSALTSRRAGATGLAVLAFSFLIGVTAWAQPRSPMLAAPAVSCVSSQVRVSAATNQALYQSGQVVRLSAAITNVSSRSCRITVGGTSPVFTVYNASGVAVWSYCSSLVRPEMCPMYLRLVTLVAHQRFTASSSWSPPPFAAGSAVAGAYRLRVVFAGIGSTASTFFVLGAPSLKTLVFTAADAGRRVVMKVDQLLSVRLPSDTFYDWSIPDSSSPVLTRISVTKGSDVTTTFKARVAGSAIIRSVGNPWCYPKCLAASRLFTLSVTVNSA